MPLTAWLFFQKLQKGLEPILLLKLVPKTNVATITPLQFWGNRIRTYNFMYQKHTPYRWAIPQAYVLFMGFEPILIL